MFTTSTEYGNGVVPSILGYGAISARGARALAGRDLRLSAPRAGSAFANGFCSIPGKTCAWRVGSASGSFARRATPNSASRPREF
jgi:hypothetical protein